MPAQRIAKRTTAAAAAQLSTLQALKKHTAMPEKPLAVDEDVSTVHPYPTSAKEREDVVNSQTGRKITTFQFKVYDLCSQIPKGQISTYKHIADALQSSSRAVGQALKVNPYAPLPVPCHRVLDSKLFIGGFMGQWGKGEKIKNKKAKLFHEGVVFDETDHVTVETRDKVIFNDFNVLKSSQV
ncbi:6-O-methylguanine DNA methyltransferase [Dissophora ornata]|nr:hypothetical protein BGZ58_009191 [Dissophora ornata]KAI8598151.1 6-O-methylguanine DNA methyltransferase [Dissophora ornata]